MGQRISRAKRKIRDNHIAYRLPSAEELPARLDPVLATIYLVFTEGHNATAGDSLIRRPLVDEAVRIARTLARLLPDEPEVVGLVALLVLSDARSQARLDADGNLVRLADQDRDRWDRDLIDEGHRLVRWCLDRNRPGPYQLQAAVNAVHTSAPSAADTDWGQIITLYDHLLALRPNPVVALNRAVAVLERDGPEAALVELNAIDLPHLPPRPRHSGRGPGQDRSTAGGSISPGTGSWLVHQPGRAAPSSSGTGPPRPSSGRHRRGAKPPIGITERIEGPFEPTARIEAAMNANYSGRL
jgi:RNA polymerase sigma-70 factor (ECF subfamily)